MFDSTRIMHKFVRSIVKEADLARKDSVNATQI